MITMPDGPPGAASAPLDPPSAGRRLAAAGALVALLVAAIVMLSLLRDPLAMVLGLVLVVVTVVAGWTALVNRGTRRVLAAAVAVAALAGTVWVLLLTGSVLRLVSVVVLVLLATAAGRVAIGHDLARTPATSRPVGPARSGVLIMNPRSGGGKVERDDLVTAARDRGVTPVVLQRGDDLRALAEEAVSGGADVIGMAGGDGSQALVADVARRHDVAFVCVPAGTRNHFALDLGLDRDDVPAALDAFGPAVERRVDLALLGERVFVNNASLGVYATVVQSDDYRDAKLATTATVLPQMLGPGARRSDLRFSDADGAPVHSADVLLVSNGAYRLSTLNGFGTRECIDAGVLGVVTVTVERARDLPALLTAEAGGQVGRFHGYREWTTPEFEVDSAEPVLDVALDGEALRMAPPLRFRSLPGVLRVRVPEGTPGAAPAAFAPAGVRSGLTALLRVAGGRPAR
ncbi:Transcription regulator [contains diacylglycerol kinase catalytic domain] [Pseudonocardia sp. Ae168_Ps1]|nr:Transcription regulator [contains diacylglycerol kinase catalytic domain] [Pseudonocardia sp. Ae150A_Ps1]OLL82496.1 Transcription regulator [contains diacylglycerol kinase catalytic domain] [Pseudonocardia sp. Ae168_Ps1]OLL83390.1 Transcription regulator [contains diacylglycerol kinase catalytic domain] [Pseudonocardia sp. Ae263_Ps1]OLL90572.1 Transcription regulator [contains diacylglycerol kinase catalytic domain] [Pseudonocardia sp. Ae356_Ps1]